MEWNGRINDREGDNLAKNRQDKADNIKIDGDNYLINNI